MLQSTNATDAAHAGAQESARERALGLVRLVPGPLIGLVVVILVLSYLSPYFLTTRNIVNIFSQVSDIGIMAVGAALVIITGGIDLSVGAVLASSLMVNAWLYRYVGMPFPLAVVAGLLFGTLDRKSVV